MGSDVTFIVEGLQAAPDTGPFVLDELWFWGGGVVRGGVHSSIGIDPLFHFYRTSAIIEFVGNICCLRGYIADLADEGDLLGRGQLR